MKILMAIIQKIRNAFITKKTQWLEWFEMKKFRRMEASRNEWKDKARERATEIRETRKARIIERERINSLLLENRQLKLELKKKSPSHPLK
jgi:hypothetical protein